MDTTIDELRSELAGLQRDHRRMKWALIAIGACDITKNPGWKHIAMTTGYDDLGPGLELGEGEPGKPNSKIGLNLGTSPNPVGQLTIKGTDGFTADLRPDGLSLAPEGVAENIDV